MKCLAVNTATTTLSVALVEDDKTLHLFETGETRDQGNLILRHMQDALRENGVEFGDIDLLAVVTGPGSFTGIRIGLSAMRAIALAAEIPLIGISSFDLFSMTGETRNLVAVESWREELYFRLGDEVPVNEAPEVFVKRLGPEPLLVSGDAAEKIAPLLANARVHVPPANAAHAARLAMQRRDVGETPVRPVPFYLREADITPAKK